MSMEAQRRCLECSTVNLTRWHTCQGHTLIDQKTWVLMMSALSTFNGESIPALDPHNQADQDERGG